MFVCGRGSRRQWGDVVIRADAAIRAEAEAEAEEANTEGASLGFWKRMKRWMWSRDRDETKRVV
jgi:hypothetical protein